MKIFIPKESRESETRIPMLPSVVKKLADLGGEVFIESGLGTPLHFPDDDYVAGGAKVSENREESLQSADIVLRLNKPPLEEIDLLKEGSLHVSYLDPFNEEELLEKLAEKKVTAVGIEMIPRTTLAQKMDAMSSQANLAGYVSVIVGAAKSTKILPMMITPAGTISPARVFVIGAGVAGLQAIATAKRLGAKVQAFDTRPEVKEQVQSLGAKFFEVDLGETGSTKDGYAKALTDEQLEMQRKQMAKVCAESDIVITTAKVFGRKAPLIIKDDMIKGMKRDSVIVDLAVETGGNVEGAKYGEEVEIHGVKIIGLENYPGFVAHDASLMYASNLYNFVSHFWDEEKNAFNLDLKDEILAGAVITHGGKIIHTMFGGEGPEAMQEAAKVDEKDDDKEDKGEGEDKKDDDKEDKGEGEDKKDDDKEDEEEKKDDSQEDEEEKKDDSQEDEEKKD